MTERFVAYIDEAGDEGFGKLPTQDRGGQSRWLILGSCLIRDEDDKQLPKWRDDILARFPNRQIRGLHFRDLSHDQRVFVSQEIAKLPLHHCLTCSHKVTIPGGKWEDTFKRKNYLYNFLLRWLLERITTHCAAVSTNKGCSLRIVFSRRANTDYNSMKDYLELMRDGREVQQPNYRIRWDVLNIDDISVESHNKWAGLQIADCVTSGFFKGLEPNAFGNYEPRYANLLRAQLLHSNGNAINKGLTGVPTFWDNHIDDIQREFLRGFMDIEKK